MTVKPRVWLASNSPRRREILTMLGFDYSVISPSVDESCDVLSPSDTVRLLARRKADAARLLLRSRGADENDIVIAADTVVWSGGEILGKPRDDSDAVRMLTMLSGGVHSVFTGVCVESGCKTAVDAEETKVFFSQIPEDEMRAYVKDGEPRDKAGAYAIQGGAAMWVDRIDGCYHNVMGMPVSLLCRLLRSEFGYSPYIDLRK